MATTIRKKHKGLSPIEFSMIWNLVTKNGEKCPDGGYIYQGVRTMVTPNNNRKLYSTISNISHVEIGKTIRTYGA